MTSPRPAGLLFATVAWGPEYADLFVRFSLPSQLAPGNIPSLEGLENSSYTIYTTAADEQVIRASDAFRALSRLLKVEFVRLGGTEGNKFLTASECYRRSIQEAARKGIPHIFLGPDNVVNDGALRTAQKLSSRYRLIASLCIRVEKETFNPALDDSFPARDDGALAVPSRELVRLAALHPHPLTRALNWNEARLQQWPSILYWEMPREGWLVRPFHVHPLLVRPPSSGTVPGSMPDDLYPQYACPDPRDAYLVQDSDELTLLDITRRRECAPAPSPWASKEFGAACWAKLHTTPLQRSFVRRPIRVHSGDLSDRWDRVEKETEREVAEIERWLRLPAAAFKIAEFAGRVRRFAAKRLRRGS